MLWRSLKYEDIYLKGTPMAAKPGAGIGGRIAFYNTRRPRQALGDTVVDCHPRSSPAKPCGRADFMPDALD